MRLMSRCDDVQRFRGGTIARTRAKHGGGAAPNAQSLNFRAERSRVKFEARRADC